LRPDARQGEYSHRGGWVKEGEAAARAGACGYVLKENLLTLKPLVERLVS
jgi:hypothetical protein